MDFSCMLKVLLTKKWSSVLDLHIIDLPPNPQTDSLTVLLDLTLRVALLSETWSFLVRTEQTPKVHFQLVSTKTIIELPAFGNLFWDGFKTVTSSSKAIFLSCPTPHLWATSFHKMKLYWLFGNLDRSFRFQYLLHSFTYFTEMEFYLTWILSEQEQTPKLVIGSPLVFHFSRLSFCKHLLQGKNDIKVRYVCVLIFMYEYISEYWALNSGV